MRTNIEIDDELMAAAMAAGRFKTKREAVEAGLALVKRQAAYSELLKLRGKLPWGWGDEERLNGKPNWSYSPPPVETSQQVQAPAASSPSHLAKVPRARR
jgi:Arc/MetJ family transcription regulator